MQLADNERSALRAFLFIEGGVLLGLAPIAAVFGALEGPDMQTLAEGYCCWSNASEVDGDRVESCRLNSS